MKRKLRGKKRYYRKLSKWAESFKLDLSDPDDWYDFWHYHVDSRAHGNQSGRERNLHLAALFTAFENTLRQLQDYKHPYQIWLSFMAKNACQDALFFPHAKSKRAKLSIFIRRLCLERLCAKFPCTVYEAKL